jgi:hypothetical protein
MRHYPLLLLALGWLALASPLQATGQQPPQPADQQPLQVRVLAVEVEGAQVSVDFQVQDASGRDVLSVKPQDVVIIENEHITTTKIIDDDHFNQQRTDEDTPTIKLTAGDGQPLELSATSATIGIVYDAVSQPRRSEAEPDTLAEGRKIIRQFLCQTESCDQLRTKVAAKPEAIGLFIPPNVNGGQVVQPREFKDFPQELEARVNLLNYLTTLKRESPTMLYGTLELAVRTTAAKAQERGGPAIVLLVSNRGDDYDQAQFDSLIKLAQESSVTIVTFRVGQAADENQVTDDQFRKLATETGGIFEAAPDESMVGRAFDEMVTFNHTSLYTARYTTTLVPDGQTQHLRVEVRQGEQQGTSASREFVLRGKVFETKLLAQVLVEQYFLIAIPIALLSSLLLTLLTGATRRSRSSGISR